MAVTPILGIPLVAPTQTDKTTTLNDAIAAMEDATQDQLAVSMASGNVTLTGTQFTRHMAFACSGLTADRDLVVPLTKRVFVVRNSSAHNVTTKGASGATVVTAAGDGTIIQNDGTGCYALASGGAGATGSTGLAGGAITIGYTFSTTTTNSDPGSGTLRLNVGTQNTATAIYLDLLAADTTDWTAVIDSLVDSTSTIKGHIRLFNRTDDSKWILFTLSAWTTHTGYRELTVAVVAASSANPFSNGDNIMLSFTREGDKGATGSPLGTVNVWTAAQRSAIVTLTDAATIATNMDLGNNFKVTLGGNRTLGNPTNVVAGQAGQVIVVQDGTGSRTLAFASDWVFAGGSAPTMSTGAAATDILSYFVIDATHIAVSVGLNFS